MEQFISTQVKQMMNIASVDTELRMLRLSFWRRIARNPVHHMQLVCCMFGEFDFDTNDYNCYTHSRYIELANDLTKMKEYDSMNSIAEAIPNPFQLFEDKELLEEFAWLDFKEMRAKEVMVAIPPPGYQWKKETEDDKKPELEFPCELRCDDGAQCTEAFSSKTSLRMHQIWDAAHVYTKPLRSWSFVITNCCPWCEAIFKTQRSAREHCSRSFKHGKCGCPINKSVYGTKVIDPMECTCVYCQEDFLI